MEWLASVVACLIVYLIRVLIYKPKRKSMGTEPPVLPATGPGSAAALSEDCAALLMRCGKQALILRDFSFRTMLTKADCADLNAMQEKLRPMMGEILEHLGLSPLSLYVYPANENTKTDRLGEYDSANRRINFYIRGTYQPEQMAAALCHECTHCFMDRNRLDDWSDRPLNERRTDVMACMIGFSRIMLNGYMVMTTARYEVIGWAADANRAGYINARDCKMILSHLKRIRKRVAAETAAAESLAADRSQLEGHVRAAEEMMQLAESLRAMNRSPTQNRLSPRELSRLQAALFSYETGELARQLRDCGSAVGGDAEAVRRADREAMDVCAALDAILSAYR